ncbi:hypothetical protein CRG98_049236, partial [Punica granatum]
MAKKVLLAFLLLVVLLAFT